jgi:hypothetical protein
MAGGLLELVAIGEIDEQFLIGNPEKSFFKAVYKKHTNFSIETQKHIFKNNVDFGKKCSIIIPKKGDLLNDMLLELELPKLIPNQDQTVSYVNSVGTVIIKSVKITIGNAVIVEHTGEWLNIWNQLSLESEKKKSYDNLVGKYGFINSRIDPNGGLYIIPLNFWFCNNNTLAFPLVSLQHHNIQIDIEFRKFEELWISSDGKSPKGNYNIVNSSLYLENIYLDRDERIEFAKKEHKYLIKQLQILEYPIEQNVKNIKIPLYFNHPIIELIWIYQNDEVKKKSNDQGNDWLNYSMSLQSPHEEPLHSGKLVFNGIDRIEEHTSKFFRLLQPYKRHTAIPDNYIYNYSFALHPEKNEPSGTCNFSRLDNVELNLNFNDNIPKGLVRIYAVNYNVLRINSGMAGMIYSN